MKRADLGGRRAGHVPTTSSEVIVSCRVRVKPPQPATRDKPGHADAA